MVVPFALNKRTWSHLYSYFLGSFFLGLPRSPYLSLPFVSETVFVCQVLTETFSNILPLLRQMSNSLRVF